MDKYAYIPHAIVSFFIVMAVILAYNDTTTKTSCSYYGTVKQVSCISSYRGKRWRTDCRAELELESGIERIELPFAALKGDVIMKCNSVKRLIKDKRNWLEIKK